MLAAWLLVLTAIPIALTLSGTWPVVIERASHGIEAVGTVIGAACWDVAVLALYGLLAWVVTTPLIPRYLLALVEVLSIPLARLSAAPLALA